jgi:charged multivesicular body protein 3
VLVGLEREEAMVKTKVKEAVRRNDDKSARMIAREIVVSRKHKERLYMMRATLYSLELQLQSALGMSLSFAHYRLCVCVCVCSNPYYRV